MEEINIDKVIADEFNPVKEIQFDIQKKYPQPNSKNTPNFILPSTGNENLIGGTGMQEMKQKASFSREVPVTEAYDLVGDEWMQKFPTYKQGSDNAEYAAQNQSGWEQTINGLSKAGTNVGSVVLGNTVGFVYGLADWAKTGNFSSVYDNSFSKTLDDWNTKLNYQLPNYYTKQEKEAGFFGSLSSANFWANDVMNGLSFTVGTIASEAIWAYATGGASLATRLGRVGAKTGKFGKAILGTEKTVEGLANYKGFVYQALDNAVTAGKLSKTTANVFAKTGEVLNTARFIATSSGNEAGIEAFHFKKEALENFYNDFEKLNGRQPTAQEIADITDKIEGAANNVFASNMAILGVSNLAMIGGMFNAKLPIGNIQANINKKLFGIGVEKVAGSEAFTAIARKSWQKGAGLLYKATAPIAREGLFEEGLQGVATKTANNWIERQYDPKYLNKVMSLSDDAWKAAQEQYGTKEGWKEIGIGGIVGILGGGFTGEFSQFSDMAKQQEQIVAPSLNAMNVTMKTLVSDINAKRYSAVAKVMASEDRADQAKMSGDAVAAKLAHNESMIATLEMHNDPIFNINFDQLTNHFNNAVDTSEVSQEEKDTIKEGFKTLVKEYKSADNFADSIVGSQGKIYGTNFQARDVKKALAYSILQGQTAKGIMDSSLGDMQSYMNSELTSAIEKSNDLEALGKDKSRQVKNLSQQYRNWEKKSAQVQKRVQELQASPNEMEGDKKSRLVEMQQKLVEIEASKSGIRTELEAIGREVVQNKKMQQTFGQDVSNIPMVDDFISVEELLNLDTKLKEVETTFQTLREVNPISAKAIEDSMNNYNKAKDALLTYNNAVKLIASGKFQPKLDNNPFSKIFSKFSKADANPDEYTGEFLTELNKVWWASKTEYVQGLQESDVEKARKTLEDLSQIEGELTDVQIEEKTKAEKIISDLGTVTQAGIKDDTPVRKSQEQINQEKIQILEAERRQKIENLPNIGIETTTSTKKREEKDKELFRVSTDGIFKTDKTEGFNRIDFSRVIREDVRSEEDLKLHTEFSTYKDGDKYLIVYIPNINATFEHLYIKMTGDLLLFENEIDSAINNENANLIINDKNKITEEQLISYIKPTVEKEVEKINSINKNAVIDSKSKIYLDVINKYNNLGVIAQIDKRDDELFKKGFDYILRVRPNGSEYLDEINPTDKVKEEYSNKTSVKIGKNQKEIDKINKEHADKIKKITLEPQVNLPPVEALKARIEDILKLFKMSFVGTYDVDEAVKNRPDQKDIERYRELKQDSLIKEYEVSGQLPIDTSMVDEFEALKEKLSQWRVYDSLAEDEQSVADLLDIVAQLETEVEQESTVAEPNVEDTFEDLKPTATVDILELSVNTNYPVTIKREKNGSYNITHMNPSSLLQRMGATNVKIGKKEVSFQEVDNQKKQGLTVDFTSGGVAMKFTIADRGRINISDKDFKAIPNVKTIETLSSWTYPTLYEQDFEGNWKPISSDFSDPNITGDSNNLKDEDALELFIDVNNEYNKKLLKDKVKDEELENQVVIYIRKGGENYGTIKGLTIDNRNDLLGSETSILTLRKLAAEALKQGNSGVVATTQVKYVQLGNPILNIDGNGRISQIAISDLGLINIEATGFVQDGEITLNKEIKDVRKSFIRKVSEKNKGKKVPIVVIKRGAQMIAFPVQMVKTNVSKIEDLNIILDDAQKTDAQKVTAINNLLIENGIAPKEFELTTLDEQKVNAIADRLDKNQKYKTAEQLADKNYKKENLINDATIALDLENLSVSLPSQKFNVDLENLDYDNLPDLKVEKQSVLEKEAEKEVETPKVISAKKQVNKSKTAIEKIQSIKTELERKINNLPDDLLFITHITSESNSIEIFNSNLLMPAGVSSTTGVVNKKQLLSILNNLSEGISPHRGYLDMFIGAIDRKTLENNSGKSLQDKLENYLDENFLEDTGKAQLPASLNIGYFTKGVLTTKYDIATGNKEQKVADVEEIAQTIVEKIKEQPIVQTEEIIIMEEKQPQINLVSFETVDFTGTPTTFYRKGNKWGYLNSNGMFDSLIPNAQAQIEQEYQAKKESEKAEKDSEC